MRSGSPPRGRSMTWPRNTGSSGEAASPGSKATRSPLVLRLDVALRQRLECVAADEQKTLSVVVRELLADALAREEAGHLADSGEAPALVEKIERLRTELRRLEALVSRQARGVLGIEQLLAHWASRGAYNVSEDDLLAELQQVGEEALRRVACGLPGVETAADVPAEGGTE